MKTTFQLNDPRKLTATLAIEMSVGDFIELRDQLVDAKCSDVWPTYHLLRGVNEIISDAEKHFYKWINQPE